MTVNFSRLFPVYITRLGKQNISVRMHLSFRHSYRNP